MSDLILKIPQASESAVSFEQQLHFMCALAYDLFSSEIYRPTKEIGNTRVVSSRYGEDADNIERMIYTLALPLNDDWRTSSGNLWMDTKIIENVPIPAGYIIP